MLTSSALLLLAPVLLSQSQPAPVSPASAAQAPTAPAQTPPAATVPPAGAAPTTADAAWALYGEAFRAAAEGRSQDALILLERLSREHPGHPAAVSAASIALALQTRAAAGPAASAPPRPAPIRAPTPGPAVAKSPEDLGARLRAEEPTALARAELTIIQTLHGIALGSEICAAASCSDSRAFILMSMFGGGAGLGASLLAVPSVTPGLTLSINSGTGWGVWNGIALNGILSSGNPRGPEATWATMVGAQLLGLSAGGLVYAGLRPSAGDVSLANSAGIWSGAMAAMLLGAIDYNGDSAGWFTTLMAVSDTGLLLGGVLASQAPMSRSRSLVIDAGGALGLLLGLGIDALIQNDHITRGPLLTMGMIGAAGGLTTAAILTHDWDSAALESGRLSLVPATRGRGATLSLAVDF